MSTSRQSDPLNNLFSDIKKIVDIIEIKDKVQADENETEESRRESELWLHAKMEEDTFVSYRSMWDIGMFQEIDGSVPISSVMKWMNKPFSTPIKFHDHLLKKCRQKFLDQYEEKNNYYRMLLGLPPLNTDSSDFIYLSEYLCEKFKIPMGIPVHQLSIMIQNEYIGTEEYQIILKNNPDKPYLRFLGMNKVDLFVARKAKDFEIIRYASNNIDVNPNLLREFVKLYADYREYIMVTLYNPQIANLHHNYRTFIGMLILASTIIQVNNSAVEAIGSNSYLDDSMLYMTLSMYGIPDSLMLTKEVRRNLVRNIPKLIREKGTKEVYYDLISILGYDNITISKLMMMKNQQFDSDNNYAAGKTDIEPYFVKVNLNDDNPYNTITSGQCQKLSYHDVVDQDPTWWDTEDTRVILRDSPYTISDSKYITIDAAVQQMQYVFESLYFIRMITDNKNTTETFNMEIPELFGTDVVSIYDLVVFIIAAMCMNSGLPGTIYDETDKLIATAGFNFDLDMDKFEEFLNQSKYLDSDRIKSFIENLNVVDKSDISRIFNDVIIPMREWLEYKITNASNRQEYTEYEKVYRAIYTYDINRNPYWEDFKKPIETIQDTFEISPDDMLMYKHFYPHTAEGAINKSDPMAMKWINQNYTFYIDIVMDDGYNRGTLYFYDLLNSEDIRTLTNSNGTRIFMDYEDTEVGWVVNKQAVEKAIELIDLIDDKELADGQFVVDTTVLNSYGTTYNIGTSLPESIRIGTFKSILKEKIRMDSEGLAQPANTYLEYLRRKNTKLYDILTRDNRFECNKSDWIDDVIKVVLSIETDLNMHIKYFEESVVGPALFFKPLITLIKHFKSTFVNIAKTGLSYIFADKIDVGGNSNMLQLFDAMGDINHKLIFQSTGYDSEFGLFDTERKMKYNLIFMDRHVSYHDIYKNMTAHRSGSIHLTDEIKFTINGTNLDPDSSPSHWMSGDTKLDDELMHRINTSYFTSVDNDGWKDFVESYQPSDM